MSRQAELPGDATGNLAEQRSISIAEFFEKNKQMLGFDKESRSIITTVKEAVDNALDACEEAGILPDLYVEIQDNGNYYTVIIEDNGPGITPEQAPKIFGKLLYGSRFHARRQSRGQQGIGISAAVMNSQLTSGNPASVVTRTEGEEANYLEVTIDTDANEPEIDVQEETSWERSHGTRIELDMAGNMRARQKLHAYIKGTATVNPHLRMKFIEPDETMKFERATDELPAETREIPPHPHGIELGTLMSMLETTGSYKASGFLQDEFTRVGRKTAKNILDGFRDTYYGRGIAWDTDGIAREELVGAVEHSVSNKASEQVDDFANRIADSVKDADALGHHEVKQIVSDAAESVQGAFNTTFGSTVRQHATDAVWWEASAQREETLTRIVDEQTTKKKDKETVAGLGERFARQFVDDAGGAAFENDCLTQPELRKALNRAADLTENMTGTSIGSTAREKITSAVWEQAKTVPTEVPKIKELANDRDMAAALRTGMRNAKVSAPPSDCLSPITAELIEAGLRKEYDAEFYASSTRDADVSSGDPFIAEAGIAYGGELEAGSSAELLRFANRVPLVYQQGGCLSTKVIKGINWRNYNLDQTGGSGIPTDEVVIMVHVASTNVPFESESKDAISNIEEIADEVELALREVGRELKTYLNKQASRQERQKKQNVLTEMLPRMSEKLSQVTGQPELDISGSMADIMNSVYVERTQADSEVTLTVNNYTNSGSETVEITDILAQEPEGLNGEASVIDMDGEWFVKWEVTLGAGEDAEITYTGDSGEDGPQLQVDGVQPDRLIVEDAN